MGLFLLVTSSSCSLFKNTNKTVDTTDFEEERLPEIQGDKVFDPETGGYVDVQDVPLQMDTVQFNEVPQSQRPPILSDTPFSGASTDGETAELKEAYNVVYVLPFLANQIDSAGVPEDSEWALNFANGAELALDNYRGRSSALNVHYLDSEATEFRTKMLLQNNIKLQTADLIIGPYRRDNVRLVGEFAKTNEIPFVSPFSAVAKLAKENPYFVQVNPGLAGHLRGLTAHAYAKSDSVEQIILVASDDRRGRNRVAYIQEQLRLATGNDELEVKKWLIPQASEAGQDQIDLRAYLPSKEDMEDPEFVKEPINATFIVANADEAFVFSFLRNINIHRNRGNITVYGLPQWYDFNMVDYELWEQLHVHISQSSFLDKSEEPVRSFRRNYYNRFQSLPQSAAFLGYDVTNYFVSQLYENGANFVNRLGESPTYQGMLITLDLAPHFYGTPTLEEGKPLPLDLYENQHVHILKFSDYHFSKIH